MKSRGILKYWKATALIKIYDRVFYDRNESNFLL